MKIHIAADDELKISDGAYTSQRRISPIDGDVKEYWTYDWMLEIGSYLFKSDPLREHFPKEVNMLGWVLYHYKLNPKLMENIQLSAMGKSVSAENDKESLLDGLTVSEEDEYMVYKPNNSDADELSSVLDSFTISDTERVALDFALGKLMRAWMQECSDTESCIPIPSIKMTRDPRLKKMFRYIQKAQTDAGYTN
jgi:hypothetical protein